MTKEQLLLNLRNEEFIAKLNETAHFEKSEYKVTRLEKVVRHVNEKYIRMQMICKKRKPIYTELYVTDFLKTYC